MACRTLPDRDYGITTLRVSAHLASVARGLQDSELPA